MSVITRPAISVSVFVTSTNAIYASKLKTGGNNFKPAGFKNGNWFELHEYDSKEAFLAAARASTIETLGEGNPTLAFVEHSAGFDLDTLITTKDIDAQVWDILSLEENELSMMQAYREVFLVADSDKVNDIVNKAQERYVGYYYDINDLIEVLSEEDEAYVGKTANEIAALIERNMVSDDHHYFTK